jgi:hypothetical protein
MRDLKSYNAFGPMRGQALHEVLAAKLAWFAAAKKTSEDGTQISLPPGDLFDVSLKKKRRYHA